MTGTAGRSRKQRCVTCTPSEWRAIKARAREEGMDASSYILSRVLDGEAPDGPPDPETGYPMALTGAEQREQFETIERCFSGRRHFLDEAMFEGMETTLREALKFLVLASCAESRASGNGTAAPPENGTAPRAEIREEPPSESETGAGPSTDRRPRQTDFLDMLDAGRASDDGGHAKEFPDGTGIEPDIDAGRKGGP